MNKFDLLFLHGWGFRSTVFDEFAKGVNQNGNKIFPCLYDMCNQNDCSLDTVVRKLLTIVRRPTVVVGWSMGGIIALRLMEMSRAILKTVFISSAPKMINTNTWHHAIEKNQFDNLQLEFDKDMNKAINVFLGLVSFGDANCKKTRKILRKSLVSEKEAHISASWLTEIARDDQRECFSLETRSMLMLFGENDVLIKPSIVRQLTSLNSNIQCETINNSGHAPFISNMKKVQRIINGFIDENV